MSVVCIAGPLRSEVRPGYLESIIIECGHTVIDAADAVQTGANALVYVAEAYPDPRGYSEWLQLANLVKVDAVISEAGRTTFPTDMVIPLELVSDTRRRGWLKDRLQALLAQDLPTPGFPRLLRVPASHGAGPIADERQHLIEALRNPSIRVAAATDGLISSFGAAKISTREDYDLARLVRWSKDRLDSAFVKLRLSLAGSDSPNSVVTQTSTSLVDVLTDSRTTDLIVLRGQPGSGKTFQLRYLETHMALASIRAGSPDDEPLVFCVNLGDASAANVGFEPMAWLESRWARRVRTEFMQNLRYRLDAGGLIMLLDGFNEIPFRSASDRTDWMLKWKDCVHEYLLETTGNRVIIACRRRDLSIGLATDEVDPTMVDMEALTGDEIIALALRSKPQAADRLALALKEDPSLTELYQTPFCLTGYLKYADADVPRSQSEIFWRRICSVLRRERQTVKNWGLFDSRWLPEVLVDHLLNTTSLAEALPVLKTIPLLRALGLLGKQMSEMSPQAGQHRTSLDLESECLPLLKEYLRLPGDADAGAYEALLVAVDLDLLEMHDSIVRFEHQTLQDFFAAITIAEDAILLEVTIEPGTYAARLGELDDVITHLGPNDQLQLVPATGFEEIFARAAEMRPAMLERAAARNPWLAAERLDRVNLPGVAKEELRSALTTELTSRYSTTPDLRERIASVTTLSLIGWGHIAKAEGFEYLLPRARVPPGTWTVGCNGYTEMAIGSVRSSHTVQLDGFAIGQFAVTNAEFAAFMADGGYHTERYWTEDGWLWRCGNFPMDLMIDRWKRRRDSVAAQPDKALRLLKTGRVSIVEAGAIIRFSRMSDDELERVASELVGEVRRPAFYLDDRFCAPLQPVVGTSWHEAMAYCAWLSEKTGRNVRLPTEDQWEAAAIYGRLGSGTLDDITLPEQWSRQWGNTAESHIGRPTPVGGFALIEELDMRRPLEMSGNVFEWVTDTVVPGEEWRRVVKGGSWRHLMRRAHPGYRGRGDTSTRNDDNTFRIIMNI